MGIKTVVLITTGQPSVNPRIVKEADALQAAGYKVTLLYCFWIYWAIAADAELLKNVKWNYQLIGGSPSYNKWQYVYTKLKLKINRVLNKIFGNKLLFAERSQARGYDELLSAAKSIKADWYIGHNLGALPIVVNASKYNNARSGFDFEDYHREETIAMQNLDLKRIVYIEEKYVPQLQYISASGNLITQKIKENFPPYPRKIITILNCFPLSRQPVFRNKSANDNSLQLFWFSQTIGKNRGLEVLLTVLQELKDQTIHVTLAGRCNKDMEMYIAELPLSIRDNIHFAGIIPPDDLPAFAATFDVGLAIELAEPNNRNICLTNKIFTYLLAGNAVILSETAAQEAFNIKYSIGRSFSINNASQLKENILFYKNVSNLELQRKSNYKLANEILNWENESKKLLSVIN